MVNASTRTADMTSEVYTSEWLSRMCRQVFGAANVVEVRDRPRQLKGIDAIFRVNNTQWLVDYKGAWSPSYLGNPPRNKSGELTFSLEYESKSRRQARHENGDPKFDENGNPVYERIKGWLVDPTKETTHLCFAWVHQYEGAAYCTSPDMELKEVEVLIVDKKALEADLTSRFNLERWSKFLLASGQRSFMLPDGEGLYMACSHNLWEEPVNIIAQQSYLRKFAVAHFSVVNNTVTHIVDEAA